MSRSSAGGSRNLLLPTPQHTPSLAGLAMAQRLSRPTTPASSHNPAISFCSLPARHGLSIVPEGTTLS